MNQVVNLGINSQTERQALMTLEANHPQVENLGSLPPTAIKKGQELLGPAVINRRESVAWAAGFIDGEGHICIKKRRPNLKTRNISPNYFVSIEVRNVKLGPLLRLRELFSGWITKKQGKGKARPLFQWEVSCRKAIACLQELLPYLTCKSQQARLVIEWRSLPITGRRFTESELTQRELYFQKLKILNATGVASYNKAKQLQYLGLGS